VIEKLAALAVVLFSSLLGGAWPVFAGQAVALQSTPDRDVVAEMVQSYHTIVTDYATGDAARAIAALAQWSPRNTEPVQRRARWDPMTMRTAAMLETDAAFDTRTGLEVMTARLDHAARWLTIADQDQSHGTANTFRRRWHLAVGRRLIFNGLVGVADRLLGDASKAFPNDLDVLFARGLAKESLAQSYIVDLNGPQNPLTTLRKWRADALSAARSAFERVVKSSPSATEARLRLAHVYVAQRLEALAVPLLETVHSSSSPPMIAYLASLMLGEIHVRRGQLQPAVGLFLDARRQFPGGQSAYLAHAHALRATGQLDAAAAVLQEMVARPKHETDPWKQYPLGFDLGVTQLGPLRDEVRRR